MIEANAVIRKIGNSNGVILDKGICERLGVSCGSEVSLLCDGGCLTIVPKKSTCKPRIGVAKGRKLVSDAWYSPEMDQEVAELLGASL